MPLTLRFPLVRQGLTARDDRGGAYTPTWRDGRAGPREARFELGFAPALDPAARELRLEVTAVDPAGREAQLATPALDPGPSVAWSITIPLPS